MKNKYYILRHGESLRNIKDISSSWPEKLYFPLTKKGEERAKEVAKVLKAKKIDLIFSSDLLRTKQTSEIVSKGTGVKPKFDKRLRELNTGVFNGKPVSEFAEFYDKEKKLAPVDFYKKVYRTRIPKGETYKEVEKRMFSFLKEIDKKYNGKKILIVSHERPITLLEKVAHRHSLRKFIDVLINKKYIKTGELRRLKWN